MQEATLELVPFAAEFRDSEFAARSELPSYARALLDAQGNADEDQIARINAKRLVVIQI